MDDALAINKVCVCTCICYSVGSTSLLLFSGVPIYSTNPGGKYHIPNEHTIQKEHKPREKDIDIIPLYCAILGAVVVGLLGYVILVHYRRMKEKRLVREPHEDVEYSKASGGDSGIYVEVEHQQKGTNCGKTIYLPLLQY